MIRKTILALCLLSASLMLLLALGGFGFGSRYIIGTPGGGSTWGKGPLVGLCCMEGYLMLGSPIVIWCYSETSLPVSTPRTDMQKYGFAYYDRITIPLWKTSSGTIVRTRLRQLVVPRWAVGMLSLLFFAYPTIVFIRGPYCRYRRRKKGLCHNCGYNLTGLPEPRCPECGLPFDRITDEG